MVTDGEALRALIRGLPAMGVKGVAFATTRVGYEAGEAARVSHPWCAGADETPVIDLRRPAEARFRSFDASVRKNVRKCERAGMTVELTADLDAVAEYAALVKEYRQRMSLPLPPLFPQVRLASLFDASSSRMFVALARVDGEAIAGLGFLMFGRVMFELGAAQGPTYAERKLPAHDVIKVAAAEYGAKAGAAFYDLAGVRREPGSEKEANIRRFKLKFTQRCAGFSVIRNRMLSPFGQAGRAVRKLRRMLPRLVPDG
jgi:lipid II:glycine glycyltransferase (peptidoglycan interpeptide bridge formation enzyme)